MTCVENLPASGSNAFSFNASCDSNTNSGLCPICTFSSTSVLDTITVSNVNPAVASASYNIVLQGFTNPPAAFPMTDPICTSWAGSSKVDTITAEVNLTFSPISSTAIVKVSSNPATNGSFAAFSVSIVLTYPIPANGSLKVYLPDQNRDFQTLGITSVKYMLPSNLSSLTATGSFKDSSGNSVSLGTVSVVGDSGGQTVTVYFTNTSALTAAGTLTAVISSLRNPPSLYPLTSVAGLGFKVQTGQTGTLSGGTKTQYGIEIVNNNSFQLTNTTPGSCDTTKASVLITPTSTIAQTGAAYKFSLIIINTIPPGGYFTLTVPSSVTVPNNSASGFSITCNAGCQSTSPQITYDSSSRIMTFKNVFTSSSGLSDGGTLTFTVTGWTNPSSFTPAVFQWASYAIISSTSYAIDTLSSVSLTVPVGTCTISSAIATDSNTQIYGIPSSYTITMKCDSAITSSYELSLIWPSTFYIQDGSCKLGSLSSLNSSYSCSGTSSTNTILIKTLTSTLLTSKTNFTFTLTGIRNPGTFGTIGSITIQLKTTGGALTTDSGTFVYSNTYFSEGLISVYTITPSISIVNQNPDTYSFVLKPTGDMWAGSTISITISTDVSIASATALQTSCGANLVGFTSSLITCSLTSKVLKISAGFPVATTNISGYSSLPAQISFDIAGFIDPPTINSAVWAATIYDVNNKAQYTWASTTTPILTMKQGTCTITAISPQNTGFYAIPTSYSFSLSCMQAIDSTCGIEITFPTSNFFIGTQSCIVTGQSSTYTCTANGTTGVIKITSFVSTTIASNTKFTFTVDSIRNPGTATGIGAIILKTLKSDGTTQDTGSYQIPNNTFSTGTITAFTATPSDFSVLTNPTSYTFSVTPIGDIPTGSTFQLTLPTTNGPTIPSTSALIANCITNLTNPGVSMSCTVNGSVISITGQPVTNQITSYSSTMSAIQFQVNQLKNPLTTNQSSAFGFQIISSAGSTLYSWSSTILPTVQMTKGLCTITSIVPSNTQYFSIPSSYQFTLSCMQSLTTSNGIRITLPTANFFVATGSSCVLTGQSTSYSCTSSGSTGTLQISNFPGATIAANTSFSFNLDSIRNPGPSTNLGGITITTLRSDGTTQDTGSFTIAATTFTTSTITAFSVSPSDYTVATTPTSYTFSITPQGDIPTGSVFYITLPTTSGPTIPSISALIANCGSNLTNPGVPITCTVSGSTIIVSGFPSTSQITSYSNDMITFQIQINQLKNPIVTTISSAFNVSILSSSSSLLYTWNLATTPTVQMSQGTCSITNVQPMSTQFYQIPSSYQFTLSCMQALTAVNGIQISMPTADFYVATGSTCILTGQSSNYSCNSNGTTGVITIMNFAATTIASNILFQFNVDSIRNPGHTTGLGTITVKTLKSDGTTVQDVGTYKIADNKFTTTSISAFTVTPSNFVVNTTPTSYTFSVTPSGDIPAGSILKLTLPATNGPTIPSSTALLADCGSNLTNPGVAMTCTISGSTINISGFPATTHITSYTSTMTALQFQINQLKNPINTTQSSNFGFSIFSSTGIDMYEWLYNTQPTVQMTQGICIVDLIQPSVTSSFYVIPISFGFSLTCMQALPTTSGIQITFPTSDFMLLNGSCTVGQQSSLSMCTVVASTGIITITNLPLATIAANTNFQFTVTNIRNANKLSGIGNIAIQTQNNSGTILDTGTYVWPALTFTNGLISTFTVTPASGKVSLPTAYTFAFQPAGDIPAGSVVKITIPTTVSVTSPQLFQTNCGYDISTGSTVTTFPLQCSISGQIITVNGIQKTQAITSWTTLTSSIIIQLQQLTNPPNVSPTTAFGLTIYNTSNNILYTWQGLVTPVVQMTQGIITIFSITATDNTGIYETPTSYTFVIQNMVTIQTTDKLTIQFPEDFFINTNIKCTTTNFNSPSLTCLASGNLYTIVLQNIVTSSFVSNKFSFTVNSIRNPGSLTTLSSPIKIFTSKSDDTLVDNGSYTMPTGYFTYGRIVSFTVIPLTGGINTSPVSYTFTIQPIGNINQGSQVEVVLPVEVKIPNTSTFISQVGSSLSGFTNTSLKVSLGSDKRTITITNGFLSSSVTAVQQYGDQATPIQFTLDGFTNPGSTNPSGIFTARILDTNNILMYKWNDITKPTIVMTNGICVARVFRPITVDNLYAFSTYEFTMTCMQDLLVGSSIQITFPLQFTLYDSSSCIIQQVTPYLPPNVGIPYAANTGYLCQTTYLTKQLIISNFQTKTYPGNSEFSVFVSPIMNAGLIGTIGVFTIKTYNASGGILDSGTYDFPDSLNTPNVITTFQVQTLNAALNQTPVTYRFKITPSGDIMKDSIITITYPPEVSIPDKSAFLNCPGTFFSGIKDNTYTCAVDSNRVITITGAFSSGGTSNLQLPDGSGKPPDLYFELIGFQNPSQIAPTSAFSAQILDSSSVLYYKWMSKTAPVLSASGVLNPISIGFYRTNTNNGQIADYTFTVVPFSILTSGVTIQIVLPPQVLITQNTICIGVSNNLLPKLSCSFSGQTINITLSLARRRILDETTTSGSIGNGSTVSPDQANQNSTSQSDKILGIEQGGFLSEGQLDQYLAEFAAIQIASGSVFSFTITSLVNPISFKPTNSIQYIALNGSGSVLEEKKTGMPVVNSGVGWMDACSTGIVPTNKDLNTSQVYQLTVAFNNYYQDLSIIITVPPQITIGQNVYCQRLSGIISPLNCVVQNTNQIVVKGAVTYETSNPGTIVLSISSLTNPSTAITSDSFQIQTQTNDGYPIDQLTQNLVIDFRCSVQCQTCSQYTDHCYSCYPTGPSQFFNAAQGTCNGGCLTGSNLVTGTGGDSTTCKICVTPAQAINFALQAFASFFFVAMLY